MFDWFKNYWWLIWGVGCTAALIAHRLRHTPEDDPETGARRSIVTRIVDPDGEREKRLPQRLLLIGVGLVLMFIVMGLVKLYERLAT